MPTVKKIEEVYLYVTDARDSAAENIEAEAFMERAGIQYVKLFYNAAAPLDDILASVNGWWEHGRPELGIDPLPPVTKYPFLTYVEVMEDIPARMSPAKYAEGIDAIKNFVEYHNSING